MNIREAFEKAVNNPENIQANGDVNWNYIDADVYMDVKPTDSKSHYAEFNRLADFFERQFGKQIQMDHVGVGTWSEAAEEGLL